MSTQDESDVRNNSKEVNKFFHPKSRKSVAMIRKLKKESKKVKAKQESQLKQALISDKLLWFQKQMNPCICPYTIEETADLIEKYIGRNDTELDQIKIKRSIGQHRNKQHASRENVILMTKERERRDYESSGLEIPNILNSNQCSLLQNWNGNLKTLPQFKFVRFSKNDLQKELEKAHKLTKSSTESTIQTVEKNQITKSIKYNLSKNSEKIFHTESLTVDNNVKMDTE